MSIIDDVTGLKEDIKLIKKYQSDYEGKLRKKHFKIPAKIRSEVRRKVKDGACIVVHFSSNKQLTFLRGNIRGGFVQVGDDTYTYDPSAVYIYKKKLPVVGLIEWRIDPIGSKTDTYYQRVVIGGADAVETAEHLDVTNFAQRTIIRGVENSLVEAKKPGLAGKNVLWIILGVIVVIYLVTQMIGG